LDNFNLSFEHQQRRKNGKTKIVHNRVQFKEGKLFDKEGNEYQGNNKFLSDALVSLIYLKQNDADKNNVDNKSTIDELVKTKEKIFINQRDFAKNDDYGAKNIFWNPKAAFEVFDLKDKNKSLGVQSAALQLGHELGHAYMNVFYGVQDLKFDKKTYGKETGTTLNDRENFIVQNFEVPMARRLPGEAIRVNYDQRREPITPKGPTSTEKENQ